MKRQGYLGLGALWLGLGALGLVVWAASPESGWFLATVVILVMGGGAGLLAAGLTRPAEPTTEGVPAAATERAAEQDYLKYRLMAQRRAGAGPTADVTGQPSGQETRDDRPTGTELADALQAALGGATAVIGFSSAPAPAEPLEPPTGEDHRITQIRLECPHCGSTTDAYIPESDAERADVTCQRCGLVFEFGPGVMFNPVGHVTGLPPVATLAEVKES